MQNIRKEFAGFTLIEILVSMTIFLSVSGAIIGIYNDVLRMNKRAQAMRLATDNARYMLEYLAREIRNGKILYSNKPNFCGAGVAFDGEIPVPSTFLPIVNVDGEKECFYFGDEAAYSNDSVSGDVSGVSPDSYQYLWLSKVSGGVTQAPAKLNSEGVVVKDLRFFVSPSTDPYDYSAGGPIPKQESVTITATIIATTDPRNTVTIPFQTTISLPLYDIPHP
jgi:prepilin-type N-terminal cleavage/methylation domain-containing protein